MHGFARAKRGCASADLPPGVEDPPVERQGNPHGGGPEEVRADCLRSRPDEVHMPAEDAVRAERGGGG